MKWLAGLLLLFSLSAGAAERLLVCFNYGCYSQAEVVYSDAQLSEIGALLGAANDAAQERAAIGVAIGRLLGWAGQQSPIAADRGGNYADDGVHGKMDCIDHSTTTTRLLRIIEKNGWLRYHRVLEPDVRRRFLIFEHYTGRIEEIARAGDEASGHYAVDSWFFDNGRPAAVMQLARWRAGESPDDE